MNIKKYKTKFLLIMLPIILSAGIITGCSGSGDGGGGGNGDNGDPTVNPQIEEVLIYQTGFEDNEGFVINLNGVSPVYNNTVPWVTGPVGKQWETFFGTPSTSSPISGMQSMQMRWYTTTPIIFGYTETLFDLPNVAKVIFTAKTSHNSSGLDVTAYYSIDGGNTWTREETFVLMTTATNFVYNVSETGEFANIRIKFVAKSKSMLATDIVQLHIDDVKVYGMTN